MTMKAGQARCNRLGLTHVKGVWLSGVRVLALPATSRPSVRATSQHTAFRHGRVVRRSKSATATKPNTQLPAWRQQIADVVKPASQGDINQAIAAVEKVAGLPYEVIHSIQVAGLPGFLQLPVIDQQAAALLSLGSPAPLTSNAQDSCAGLNGTQSIEPAQLDASSAAGQAASHTVEIAAEHIQTSDAWQHHVRKMSLRGARGLDVCTPYFEARLQKLVLYTAGAQHAAEGCTDEDPKAFGTMVVQLPVTGGHQGGMVTFSHFGKDVQWVTDASSGTTFYSAVSFTAVKPVMQPITSGMRAVLVYQLVHTRAKHTAMPFDWQPLVQQLSSAVASWEQDLSAGVAGTPDLLCVPISDKYDWSNRPSVRKAWYPPGVLFKTATLLACLNHPTTGLDVLLAAKSETYKNKRTYTVGVVQDNTDLEQSVWIVGNAFGTWLNRPVSDLGLRVRTPLQELQFLQGDSVIDQDKQRQYPKISTQKRSPLYSSPVWDSDIVAGDRLDEHTTQVTTPMLIIMPKSQTKTMLGNNDLPAVVHQLQSALHSGTTQQVAAALRQTVRMFRNVPYMAGQHVTLSSGGKTFGCLGSEEDIGDALIVISKIGSKMAVWALTNILQHLPTLGDPSARGPKLPDAIVRALLTTGPPAELITALQCVVVNRAQGHVEQCTAFTLAALKESQQLGEAVAEALLSYALPSSGAHKVVEKMTVQEVLALADMLCKLPAYQQHLITLTTAVLAIPENHLIIEKLLKGIHTKEVMSHSPQAVAMLAQARCEHLTQVPGCCVQLFYKIEPQEPQYLMQSLKKEPPVFSWEMKEACIPDNPELEAFLHGPETAATFKGWSDLTKAQLFVRDTFRWLTYNTAKVVRDTYSAEVKVSDPIERPTVTITKTRDLHEWQVKEYNAHVSILQREMDNWTAVLKQCVGR